MKILSAEFIKSCHRDDQLPRDHLPQVAFVGRSNVGKSALINSLLNRRRLAQVSRTPGKTRALHFMKVQVATPAKKAFYVVDLPGYGYAKVSKSLRADWGPLIERYLTHRRELVGVVLLIDSRGPGQLDRPTLQWLQSLGLHVQVVTTKVDKLSRSEKAERLRMIREHLGVVDVATPIAYSSVTHEGRDHLWRAVGEMLDTDRIQNFTSM